MNRPRLLPLAPLAYAAICAATVHTAAAQDRGDQVYQRAADSVFMLQMADADGSTVGSATGFLVEPGLILTNAHVANAGSLSVQTGGVQIPCDVERTDDVNDLALCRIHAKTSASPLTLAAAEPKPGSSVFAIGNPRGFEKTISQGLFSGHRTVDGQEVAQVSAPISPGSSGGPILDAHGDVVGVAASFLVNSQNLNFAVPLEIVRRFLRNEPLLSDSRALIAAAKALDDKRAQMTYSEAPDSEWAKADARARELLTAAIAGTTDVDVLRAAFAAAGLSRSDVAVAACRKIVKVAKSPGREEYFNLAKALYYSTDKRGPSPELEEAEKAATRATELARPLSIADLQLLSDIQAQARKYDHAYSTELRAVALLKSNDGHARDVYFAMFRLLDEMDRPSAAETWFARLKTIGTGAFEWTPYAEFLEKQDRREQAAAAYTEAFKLQPSAYKYVCSAGADYYLADALDDALAAARRCIDAAVSRKNSDDELGQAHRIIAAILNRRGVYEEGAAHAREAIAIDGSDAWAYHDLAEALVGERRFNEAIAAARSAIRASDGKYASMHFQLGSAYFRLKQWQDAAQSYEKAAELAPKDPVAAFDAGVSLYNDDQRDGALTWFREAARRDPEYEREKVAGLIQELSARSTLQ